MTTHSFFDNPREQSLVKATIVGKYFLAWANVILSQNPIKIAYIDLFAGPGRYEDGTPSTPLLVLEQAIEHPKLRERLVTLFNDKDMSNVLSLEEAIRSLPGVDTLCYAPEITHQDVGDEIIRRFEQNRLIPTLCFIDPWGYKGLSLRLISAVIRNWGCDCIFFFNYNRIRMGLHNPYVEEHMHALFGEKCAQELRKKLNALNPHDAELTIIEELSQVLKQHGRRYVLPFRFLDEHGTRTSHHLIFVSKHFRGYSIMKEIMAKASSDTQQGVASFAYNPADQRQPLLFELSRPLDDLAAMLLAEFAGRTLTMKQIYEQHSVDKPYTKSNYKAVLRQLEEAGRIVTEPARRKADTFADDVQVTFPSRVDK